MERVEGEREEGGREGWRGKGRERESAIIKGRASCLLCT